MIRFKNRLAICVFLFFSSIALVYPQEAQKDLDRQKQEAEARYHQDIHKMLETVNTNNQESLRTMSLTILAVVIIVLALFVFLTLRQQKAQQEQFRHTLNVIQNMRTADSETDKISLPFALQDIGGNRALPSTQSLLIEDTYASKNLTDNAHEKLKHLLITCQTYAEEINKATGRRNATHLVADLVYKVSRYMGCSEHDSILYFSAGLVYDIGFLNIDSSILHLEHINEEQFNVIKTHSTIGLNMVFFVDEHYRPLFKEAVSKHHENLDGSGYPTGLKDKDIPYIARVLRVVESYVAIISSREYRQIKDRNSAIQELRLNPGHYDQNIVDALDAIV